MADPSYGSTILDPIVARVNTITKWKTRGEARQERMKEADERLEQEERDIQMAKVEILKIEARIQDAKDNGDTKLEKFRFVSGDICVMPVKALSWYEIQASWIRNPERMILASFERGERRVEFEPKFDHETRKCLGSWISISWE